MVLDARTRTGLKWKAWNILCGISGSPLNPDESEEDRPKTARVTAEEDPKWARIALVNGVLLGALCVFVLAWYG